MRRPRLRFTLRSLMGLVAVAALMLAGAPVGMKLGLKLKEEVRARRAVVYLIQSLLAQSDSRVNSIEIRLARSERQAVRDPRHDHWLEEIAFWREEAASCRRDLPIYERLAGYPWLPFPAKRWDRDYLPDSALAYINRHQEAREAAIWSGAGAAVVLAGILILTMILVVCLRRHARNRASSAGAIMSPSTVTPEM